MDAGDGLVVENIMKLMKVQSVTWHSLKNSTEKKYNRMDLPSSFN